MRYSKNKTILSEEERDARFESLAEVHKISTDGQLYKDMKALVQCYYEPKPNLPTRIWEWWCRNGDNILGGAVGLVMIAALLWGVGGLIHEQDLRWDRVRAAGDANRKSKMVPEGVPYSTNFLVSDSDGTAYRIRVDSVLRGLSIPDKGDWEGSIFLAKIRNTLHYHFQNRTTAEIMSGSAAERSARLEKQLLRAFSKEPGWFVDGIFWILSFHVEAEPLVREDKDDASDRNTGAQPSTN